MYKVLQQISISLLVSFDNILYSDSTADILTIAMAQKGIDIVDKQRGRNK